MLSGLRILVLSPTLPRPDRYSGDRRLFAFLELLTGQGEVALFGLNALDDSQESHYSGLLRSIRVRVISQDSWGWLGGVLCREAFDLIIFEFWYTAYEYRHLIARHQPTVKVIIDSVDLAYLREIAAVELGVFDADKAIANRDNEIREYRASHGTIVVSHEDFDALRAEIPAKKVYLIPNIVPIRSRPNMVRSKEVSFVGGFGHPPNIDGVLWFVNEVWPLIRQKVPSAFLTIVGTDPTPEIQDLNRTEGVLVTGYVPDTAPYLDRAAVSIAPLRFGGGMKGKVSEALASGVPVVTTSFGAQGFGLQSEVHALVSDSPKDFAESVIHLLNDPIGAEKMGLAGQQLVQNICGPDVVRLRVQSMLNCLFPVRSSLHRPGLKWHIRSIQSRLLNFCRNRIVLPLRRFRRRSHNSLRDPRT